MTEELNIRHQVQVRLPEGTVSKLVFIKQVQHESELLPVTLLVLVEELGVLGDDLTDNGVLLGRIHCHQHLVGDAQKGFTVCDRGCGAHAHQSAFEIGRVLKFGLLDTV